MNTLDEWLAEVGAALGVAATDYRDTVLHLTRDVAHGVARPAAPLTAFLVGLAAGAAGGDGAAVRRAAETVAALAERWAAEHGEPA